MILAPKSPPNKPKSAWTTQGIGAPDFLMLAAFTPQQRALETVGHHLLFGVVLEVPNESPYRAQ
jgi:hypothetical protein